MRNLEMFLVQENNAIREVMSRIAHNSRNIAFICENGRLLATVTDGDIRRYLLNGGGLDDCVSNAAHYTPIYAYEEDRDSAETIMKKAVIMALPIVDHDLKIVDIVFLNKFKNVPFEQVRLNTPVVIMAGGKGTRLKPFTDILPKPLIPLEEKTITEHIMDRFEEYGCSRFYMIVNYKKNFIKSYFSDNDTKHDLHFIDEEEYLGTAGGLKLLQGKLSGNFFMSNCDILIEADYQDLLEYHLQKECIITMVCAQKKYQIPYGTVEEDGDGYVQTIQEKPGFVYNVNTGLYVISDKFLDKLPDHTHADMTDLITRCIEENEKVGIYLIEEEQWLDVGQLQELQKTRRILDVNYIP